MKAVAETLGVARSSLAERQAKSARPRGPYRKPEDEALLPTIREIVDARPSYGYRRITALVNRVLRSQGKPVVNAKRVLRIMRANGLTLAPHTALRPGRTHDGVVVALRSNVRWCSDHLELHCRDRSIVRVLFAIDACDRRDYRLVGHHGRRLRGDGARPDGRVRRAPVRGDADLASGRVALG
jgi:transposase InsO family protein